MNRRSFFGSLLVVAGLGVRRQRNFPPLHITTNIPAPKSKQRLAQMLRENWRQTGDYLEKDFIA